MNDGTAAASGTDRPRPPEGDWLGTPYLQFERRGSLAVVTVDRPERRNSMTPAMYFGVRYAVDLVNRDESLAGLLLTGSGDVFIPGGDLGGDNIDGWADLPRLLGMDNTPFEAVRLSRKPVVCAVNGLAQGGGMMIAMLADVAIASDRATFRAPELFRGIADTNYGQILPRQIGPARARDMLMTGRVATADEAQDWGLVARVVPHDDLMTEAVEALTWCCRAAPGARAAVKRVMDDFYGHYDRMAMDASLSSQESVEGFMSFKERRNPSWVPPELRTDGRI
jgi:enoyl-CoA hydratase